MLLKKAILLSVFVLLAAGCSTNRSYQSNNPSPQGQTQNKPMNQDANQQNSAKANVHTIPNGRSYTNSEYNFQFQVPEKTVLVSNDQVFDFQGGVDKSTAPGLGVQIIKFDSLPKTITDACKEVGEANPNCKGLRSVTQEEYAKFKDAIASKNSVYIKQFMQNIEQDVTFVNNGILVIFKSAQAPGYQIEFNIFDKNNNLIKLTGLGAPAESKALAKQSSVYQALMAAAQSFKF